MTSSSAMSQITHAQWDLDHPADAAYHQMRGNQPCHGLMETDDSGTTSCTGCSYRVVGDQAATSPGGRYIEGRSDRDRWAF